MFIQAINVVDNPEFRDFVLYGHTKVTDRDLPHRTKLVELIFNSYDEERRKLADDFKGAQGRISFTSDCWSDPNLTSFLALTAHFISKDADGHLAMQNRLLAFRVIDGKHTGKNLGTIIFEIIKTAGILGQVGEFTFDNASNCDTTMETLEELFRKENIPFCRIGNRIRCFPHVVNISVQTVIKELNENPSDPVIQSAPDPSAPSEELKQYAAALKSKPVIKTREIIATCRRSGERRAELKTMIETGNATSTWPTPGGKVRVLQLLRDCETRWSSTFNMIDRMMELYLVRAAAWPQSLY